jgi:hypothetical protein
MAIFDADQYYMSMLNLRRHWIYEPAPINRAPMVNLQKLPYEKKIIPIAVLFNLVGN